MRTTTNPDELLIERFLHPAWRLALVTTDDPALAEESTIVGFVEGVAEAERTGTEAIGTEIVAATRRAVLTKGAAAQRHPHHGDSTVVAAFHRLNEKARSAVWLTEVEGGSPQQVAPVLGLDPEAAARVCERASATMRSNLADSLASRAANDECRSVLSRVHLHAAAQLPDSESREMSLHISGCRSCSVLLAVVVSPRPLLRGIALEVPESLAPAVAARLAARHEGTTRTVLHPFTRRTVGAAAAAAVLALGVGAAALLGGAGGDDVAPQLSAPAAVELDTEGPTTGGLVLPPTGSSVAVTPISSTRPSGSPTSTPIRAIDRARSLGSVPPSTPPSGGPATPGTQPAGTVPVSPSPPAPPDDGSGPVPELPGVPPLPIPELPIPGIPGLPAPTDPSCTGVELLDGLLGCDAPTGTSLFALPTLPGL